MTSTTEAPVSDPPSTNFNPKDPLIRARLDKLARWRDQYNISGYGERVEDITSLADARAMFSEAAHDAFEQAKAEIKDGDDPDARIPDVRPSACVAGRVIQHRAMGKLVFLSLRDHSGDLQISISKQDIDPDQFKLASKLDYGDIITAEGPIGMTKKGEICVWATSVSLQCKSLVPPPEKYHGLADAELRYRHRYIDMYANPETMQTFIARSEMVSQIRRFMDDRGYHEAETPMMSTIAGGAAARPFMTHHNALDLELYMRIATELHLKRLLVGGMPRVYEVGRQFRNEGIDRSHNPEFTTMEVYEAFGDCWSMLELTESLLHELARDAGGDGTSTTLPFGDLEIDYARPFARVKYGDLFEQHVGFAMTDEAKVRTKAKELKIEKHDTLDHWLLVNEVYERECEDKIDPSVPTFVTDYPSVISPLTRPQKDNPHLCDRWELLVGGMELGTAYTELNDPEVQLSKFTEQLTGADEEEQMFRTMDEDFLHALRVGMPPAGGLGLGIDRIIMLLTNQQSIRDVILFPLMRPTE